MPTNATLLHDRFTEIASVTALKQLASHLSDLAMEPSTKRFVRNRAAAATAWSEVRELAIGGAAAAAAKPVATTKRASKPKTAPAPATPAVDPATTT